MHVSSSEVGDDGAFYSFFIFEKLATGASSARLDTIAEAGSGAASTFHVP